MKYLRMGMILIFGLVIALGSSPLLAGSGMGLVVFKKGASYIYKGGVKNKLKNNSLVNPGDTVQTTKSSRVSIQFASGIIVQVGPASRVKISSITAHKSHRDVNLSLSSGSIAGRKKGKYNKLQIRTPTAIASVRGTDFIVETNDESGEPESKVMVDKGRIDVNDKNSDKTVVVKTGTKAVVSKTKGIISGILEAHEKQKFAIMKQFNRQKKANLEMIIEQKRKNQEMLRKQRSLFPR